MDLASRGVNCTPKVMDWYARVMNRSPKIMDLALRVVDYDSMRIDSVTIPHNFDTGIYFWRKIPVFDANDAISLRISDNICDFR